MADQLLTTAEVADILRIPQAVVLRRIRRRELAAINISSPAKPRYRVRQSALNAFLAARETQVAS